MKSSRSRQDILESVRSRYIQKYGREASPTIDSALKKVELKNKLDLESLDTEIKHGLSPRGGTTLKSYKKLPAINQQLTSVLSQKRSTLEKPRYRDRNSQLKTLENTPVIDIYSNNREPRRKA